MKAGGYCGGFASDDSCGGKSQTGLNYASGLRIVSLLI